MLRGPIASVHLLRSVRSLWVVLVAALVASTNLAQSATPLTLGESQRLALQRSPQLESQRSMADASREMSVAAGELPDPQLLAGVENVPVSGVDRWSVRDGMTMARFGIMQEVPRTEKRRLRTERALREAERIEVVAQTDALTIRREASVAWLNTYFAQQVQQTIAAQASEVELQLSIATAAFRAGRGSQNDVLVAQQALIDLRNRATESQLAERRARLALARYVGHEAERPLAAPPDLQRLPYTEEQLVNIDTQPEVRRLEAQASVLDTEARLARAMREPDWSVELSYGVRRANPDMVSLMFRMDLPWSPGTRQDREWAAKLKERDAAKAMREDVRRMREAEVRQMIAEWQGTREQSQRLGAELVPLARSRTEAALASYRGGMGTLAMVLDARRGELDARLMLINMELASARAWAWLANVVYADIP